MNLLLTVVSPHRGAILPAARVVVVMVPVAAMCFYVFVVKRNQKR